MSKYISIESLFAAFANKDIEFIPADAEEVRHGRWIDVEPAPDGLLYATCSVCGKRQTVEATNYCGNCGAKMEGAEE